MFESSRRSFSPQGDDQPCPEENLFSFLFWPFSLLHHPFPSGAGSGFYVPKTPYVLNGMVLS
jgi:hypothetical protein